MAIERPIPAGFPIEADRPMVWTYAGFWWRVLAAIIDLVVIGLADRLIGLVTGLRRFGFDSQIVPEAGSPVSNVAFQVQMVGAPRIHAHGDAMLAVSILLAVAYFTVLESSRWQATVGKRVCSLRVTDLTGRRIGWLRALGRYLGKFVSAALFMIGFLMVGWTRRKQGLHDMMAGTLVMRLRPADTVFAVQPPG